MKLTKKQRLKDEQVLAAILAGAATCGRKVLPHSGHDGVDSGENLFGVHPHDSQYGPCCAVGAGVLYAGLETSHDACSSFAEKYEVSYDYANAVSDGFETPLSRSAHMIENSDFCRGFDVGKAAFQILCLHGRGA